MGVDILTPCGFAPISASPDRGQSTCCADTKWIHRSPYPATVGCGSSTSIVVRISGVGCLALARPQIVERRVIRTGEGLDILLAIDTSCSMEASDMSTSVGPCLD